MLLHRAFLFPVYGRRWGKGLLARSLSRGAGEAPGGHRGKQAAGLGCGRAQVRFENVLGCYVADGVKPCPWGFSCPHIGRAPSAQPPHQSKVLGRVGRSGGGITCAGVPRSSEGFPFPRHVASPHYPSHKRAQRQPEEIHGVALENLAAIPRSQIEGVHGGDGVADEA